MKKLLSIGFIAFSLLFFVPLMGVAQISREAIVGKWGIVDFAMVPKNKKGKLTSEEIETVKTFKDGMVKKPKFMSFVFNRDGLLQTEPSLPQPVTNAGWELNNDVISLKGNKNVKTNKYVEKYKVRLLDNGRLEMTVLKSKKARYVMTFEKE